MENKLTFGVKKNNEGDILQILATLNIGNKKLVLDLKNKEHNELGKVTTFKSGFVPRKVPITMTDTYIESEANMGTLLSVLRNWIIENLLGDMTTFYVKSVDVTCIMDATYQDFKRLVLDESITLRNRIKVNVLEPAVC